MAALIESETGPMAPFDLAAISRQLADDVGRLVPDSDGYSVEDYFSLDGNYLVEFNDGRLQVLPMPDSFHQALGHVLRNIFERWLERDPEGRVIHAPFKVYTMGRLYREPDVAVMLGVHAERRAKDFWRGADLVVEIISETNRDHDLITKMGDYAAAGIPEYWIVDPAAKAVSALALTSGKYEPMPSSTEVVSRVLGGLVVDVADLFTAAVRRA